MGQLKEESFMWAQLDGLSDVYGTVEYAVGNTALVWLTLTSVLMYVGPALASVYFVLTTPNSAEGGNQIASTEATVSRAEAGSASAAGDGDQRSAA
jgi:hypothetical protein